MSVHAAPPAALGAGSPRHNNKRLAVNVLKLVAARLAGLLGTLFVASIVIFGALYLAPGSPLTFLTHGRSMSPEAIAQLEQQYHLDEPVPLQYLRWLGGVLHGDFGTSILFHESVGSLLGSHGPITLVLVVLSAILVIAFGLAVGVFAGLRPGVASSSIMAAATAVMAVPAFVAAVVLTLVFAVVLGWFPVFGTGNGGLDTVYHLILPAIALSLASVAFVGRLAQAAIRQEMKADHVQTAISRGLPYRFVIRRHVLRNAAMPVLTVAGLTIAGLIAGSVVVEQVFQLNGLGSLLVTSVQQKDFPVVQGICLVYVAAFIVLNTLIDLAYSVLDPRVPASGRKQ
ncbi:ABC transporter permease [Specibacter cremeus]|uniref:ABC transporter permease n=1 Tax=Specibacter cremeus TaxID=1629051 RepID=UPI0013DDE854|nr:ABC transporter permease [Specibacter cremeus]